MKTIRLWAVLLVALLAACGGKPTSPPTAAEFVLQFTGDPDPLQKPAGIAVDKDGNLYVLDESNFRIQKFDGTGKPLAKWGMVGSGDGQFAFYSDGINSLAVDGQGNVYVTDGDNHRVQKFDSNGQFLTKWGLAGTGDGQFSIPSGIAVDSQGNVYVADLTLFGEIARIQKFDSNGRFLTQWGSAGTGDGQFNACCSVAVDGQGNVYASDALSHRIQKFDTSGKFLAKFGSPGSGDGEFNGPGGLAVDAQGNVYVADFHNNRIQKFDSTSKFLFKWGSAGVGDGEFIGPNAVALDAQGNVYVADYENDRIQKFRQK
jgi:tripartite motif-containing protein 71